MEYKRIYMYFSIFFIKYIIASQVTSINKINLIPFKFDTAKCIPKIPICG